MEAHDSILTVSEIHIKIASLLILDSCYPVRWYGPTKNLVDETYKYPTVIQLEPVTAD